MECFIKIPNTDVFRVGVFGLEKDISPIRPCRGDGFLEFLQIPLG